VLLDDTDSDQSERLGLTFDPAIFAKVFATLLLHCCYTVVTMLLHCCYTVVTLLLHCCYIAATLLLHCCYTVVTLLLHCCYTVVTLLPHCCHTAATLLPHCCHTAATLLPHCCHTAATLFAKVFFPCFGLGLLVLPLGVWRQRVRFIGQDVDHRYLTSFKITNKFRFQVQTMVVFTVIATLVSLIIHLLRY
jgi:hypothetical protein